MASFMANIMGLAMINGKFQPQALETAQGTFYFPQLDKKLCEFLSATKNVQQVIG